MMNFFIPISRIQVSKLLLMTSLVHASVTTWWIPNLQTSHPIFWTRLTTINLWIDPWSLCITSSWLSKSDHFLTTSASSSTASSSWITLIDYLLVSPSSFDILSVLHVCHLALTSLSLSQSFVLTFAHVWTTHLPFVHFKISREIIVSKWIKWVDACLSFTLCIIFCITFILTVSLLLYVGLILLFCFLIFELFLPETSFPLFSPSLLDLQFCSFLLFLLFLSLLLLEINLVSLSRDHLG